MTIQTVEDVTTGQNVTLATGIVAQLSVKPLENDKYDNTHKFGIRIGDDWINNINVKTKEGFEPSLRINMGDRNSPDWKEVEVGDEVRIVVKPNEYNNKTYYNAGVSKIRITKKGEGNPKPTQNNTSGGKPSYGYDPLPVTFGNCLNIAHNILGEVSVEELNNKARELYPQAAQFREKIQAKYPDRHGSDVGPKCGAALLFASERSKELTDILNIAEEFIDAQVVSEGVVRGSESSSEGVATQSNTNTQGSANVASAGSQGLPEGFDDDIPF